MAYVPTLAHARTDAERADPKLAWMRSEEAFFASGACHILAFTFRGRHPDRDLILRFIDPADGFHGTHLYVLDGDWAFDFNGWTLEQELLATTRAAYEEQYPGWTCELVDIDTDLEAYCRAHDGRQPRHFAGDVVARAEQYLVRFPDRP